MQETGRMMKDGTRIVFCGSSPFSVEVLHGLREAGAAPVLVLTTEDKPRDRGYSVKGTPVKDYASIHSLPWMAPASLRDNGFLKKLEEIRPDIILVASYGKIIPPEMLAIPAGMALCVHPSLLPRYRGAAPLQRVLLDGEKETGVTIFRINERIDAGPMLLQKKMEISDADDSISLSRKLEGLSVTCAVECLGMLSSGHYELSPQDEGRATYAAKLTKEDGRIDWNVPASRIVNVIRATRIWPTAYTFLNKKRIQIVTAESVPGGKGIEPGVVADAGKEIFDIASGEGLLRVREVKPEGKKVMDSRSFICGYKIRPGDRFC